MIRALVVEDEPASRARIRSLVAGFAGVEVVGECGDGVAAVEAIVQHKPDLVLLDVQLPELDGFEVLDALPADQRPAVVFITAYDEFAIRAFDANAVDYVLKPFSKVRFTRAVSRAIERLQRDARAVGESPDRAFHVPAEFAPRKPLRRFVARTVNKVYFVSADDVDWIDVADNYLRLHVAGREHLVRGTASAVLERLDPEQFVRINRGAIVRVDAISTIEAIAPATYRVTTRDGARLTSSRRYAESLRALMKS